MWQRIVYVCRCITQNNPKILCFILKMIKDIEDIVEVVVEVGALGEEEVAVQEM